MFTESGMGRALATKISRKQLDRRLTEVRPVVGPTPAGGWVRAVRTALGMSMRQMAERMSGASPSAIVAIENNEVSGALTLRRLRAAAEALDCEVFYVLVPKAGTLEATLQRRAEEVVGPLMTQVTQHMHLEDQGVDDGRSQEQRDELVSDLLREPRSHLWGRIR